MTKSVLGKTDSPTNYRGGEFEKLTKLAKRKRTKKRPTKRFLDR
jgi:hypothetical protein